MKMRVLFFMLFAAAHCYAQAPAQNLPPLPSRPLAIKAPSPGKWETTCIYGNGAARSAGQASEAADVELKADVRNKRSVTVRVGEKEVEEALLSDGRKVSRWRDGAVEILERSDSSTPAINIGRTNGASFSGLDWISPKNYRSAEEVDGRTIYVFEDEVPLTKQMMWHGQTYIGIPPNVPAIAKIEAGTFLPIMVVIGDETRKFRYLPPPAVVSIPAEIEAAIKGVNQKNNVKVPAPPRP